GFLLTSVRNWTGLDTPSGTSLALLALLWLAPRLLSFVPALPPMAFAMLDSLFLLLLAVVLGRLILRAKLSNNYPIPALLVILGLCNAAVHADVLGFAEGIANPAMKIAVLIIIALMSVIAGRVLPFFMQRAIGVRPANHIWVEKLSLPSVLLFAAVLASGQENLIIITALLTACIHGIRLIGWSDRAVLQQPMLWVLHAGYAWLVAGFLLYAIAEWMEVPTVQAVHAWTVGGIGIFTLGMMARVALGHTGRNIEALPLIPAAFILMMLAALIRVIVPGISPAMMEASVLISAICWLAAFAIVALRYTAILLHARVDGKPG
ncbi:MAG: NnrS family protein, partial [Mariprofundaceae bacterium]|nr:NnrS family protein [Mariprofundaceae bacterium]